MKRILSLPGESLASATQIAFEVPQSKVANATLELALLLEGYIDSLRIRCSRGPSILLTMIDDDRVSKARISRNSDESLHFVLGRNQAEYLHAFLLRAYRDQYAAVDHLHIEGHFEGHSNADSFDLTVMFDVFRPPLPPDEGLRLALELDKMPDN